MAWVLMGLIFLSGVAMGHTLRQEIVRVEWNGIRQGQVPVVSRSLCLGRMDLGQAISVRLEYPEYVRLSANERKALQDVGYVPAESLSVSQNIGRSRGECFFDVQFVPIRKSGRHWERLVSAKLVVCMQDTHLSAVTVDDVAADGSAATRYVQHSVLSTGRWVKIRVQEEGVYALTHAQLAQMGFAHPEMVKVFGYGGRILNDRISYGTTGGDYDDLEEIPLYRRGSDVLFWAEGTVRWGTLSYNNTTQTYVATHRNNPYSRYSYYFVTEGDSPAVLANKTTAQSVASSVIKTFPEHSLIDPEEYSWYTSGRNLYERYNYGESGNSRTYNLAAPDADTTQAASLYVIFSAYNQSGVTQVTVKANGNQLGQFNIGKSGEYDHAISGSRLWAVQGLMQNNKVNITTTAGVDARLDVLRLDYMRKLNLRENFLCFSSQQSGSAVFQITNANADTRVWQLGRPGDPLAGREGTLAGNILSVPVDDASLRYVALNTSATFPQPEVVGTVTNQDLHADSSYTMVIIVPESGKLTAQAQRLAQWHAQHDGMSVKVVRADEIYNEFSSGTPDACAYRRYLKKLYDCADSEKDMPRYLLLMGSSVWDNRMLTSECAYLNPKDYLLCYESEASLSEVDSYVTDDYFGLLDDGEGSNLLTEKIDLGIGRLPVTTADEAQVMVDKIIDYAQNTHAGSWKNNIYMLADDGDANQHMEGAEAVAQLVESQHPNLNAKRIYWDAYERVSTATGHTYPSVTSDLKSILNNKGALVMNYMGHGAPYSISHELVLRLNDFKEASSNKVPLWVIASCIITPFDMLEETIGETAMLNKKSGTIGFFSASRAVYSMQNGYLNNHFMNYLLARDANGRRNTIGDAARMCKVRLVTTGTGISQNDLGYNKLKYALMGDPALTLSMPTDRVVVDEVDGKPAGTAVQFQAGSQVRIKGHVEKEDGTANSDFNGSVSLTLMDSKDTITCRNNAGADVTPLTYSEHTKKLYEGMDSVRNGQFEMTVPVPIDIKYSNGKGRVSLYALSADKTGEANGTYNNFTVGGTSSYVQQDSLGPAIFLYLNNPDFQDGGTVNETPYFVAQLSDPDGINATGNGMGHDLELIIDGEESRTYVLNNYYTNDFGNFTNGSVAYLIPQLEEGKHRLFFRAWDMKNNSSTAVLNFNVKTGLRPSLLSVALTNNPAVQATTFLISYDRPDTETEFTIHVYDCFGRLWWKHTETGTSANGMYTVNWDLTSNNGISLPGGLYLYQVSVSCNGSKESTKTEKLIIHKQ
ncbi:MAG: type IX secretion system sortase PorU [Bacteroidaceae bacterium]|nr:type IX secretion system sortase PorU [Bacteroidaceae bacterium]